MCDLELPGLDAATAEVICGMSATLDEHTAALDAGYMLISAYMVFLMQAGFAMVRDRESQRCLALPAPIPRLVHALSPALSCCAANGEWSNVSRIAIVHQT